MQKQDQFENIDSGLDCINNNQDNNELNQPSEKPLPKKIKLEITTAFEITASILAFVTALITAMMLFYFSRHGGMINLYTISAIIVSIILLILRFNIDEYYVLDVDRQALMLKKKLFSKETYIVFAPFKSIEATVGNGRFNNGGKNSKGYWEYRAEIILNTGKVIPIDDWHREDLGIANSKADSLAQLANAQFIPGMEKVNAKPILENGKHTFIVTDNPPNEIKINGFVAFLIVAAVIGIFAVYVTQYL